MLVTSDELAIDQYELDKVRPATIIEREEDAKWVVRETPLLTNLDGRFLWTIEHGHVRIPLFPYLTPNKEPPRAMAIAAKLGVMLVAEFYDWLGFRDAPLVHIERLHISIGHPIQETASGLRFWLGFAMQLKGIANG